MKLRELLQNDFNLNDFEIDSVVDCLIEEIKDIDIDFIDDKPEKIEVLADIIIFLVNLDKFVTKNNLCCFIDNISDYIYIQVCDYNSHFNVENETTENLTVINDPHMNWNIYKNAIQTKVTGIDLTIPKDYDNCGYISYEIGSVKSINKVLNIIHEARPEDQIGNTNFFDFIMALRDTTAETDGNFPLETLKENLYWD